MYDPSKKPSFFSVDSEKVKHWLSVGARPTDTVKRLLKSNEI